MKKRMTFARFDADLNTDVCDAYDNAELTLTLRMGFRQINPAGNADEGTYHDYGNAAEPTRKIIKWTDGSWANWKAGFVRSAQQYWHGKFWLINDGGLYPVTSGSGTYYPNVWCRFVLVGNEATVPGNHHTIDVVRLHASEKWFGSHSTLYDSLDTTSTRKNTTSDGKKVMQKAHVHEVGHLLGLSHVDVGKPHCMPNTNTNAGPCYGISDADMTSVMGAGMTLRLENAYPWRETMRYFALAEALASMGNVMNLLTGRMSMALPVQAASAIWPAKMRRHYPRTLAEVQAGTLITQRPLRPR